MHNDRLSSSTVVEKELVIACVFMINVTVAPILLLIWILIAGDFSTNTAIGLFHTSPALYQGFTQIVVKYIGIVAVFNVVYGLWLCLKRQANLFNLFLYASTILLVSILLICLTVLVLCLSHSVNDYGIFQIVCKH